MRPDAMSPDLADGSSETHRWAISRRASSRRRREVEAGAAPLDRIVVMEGPDAAHA